MSKAKISLPFSQACKLSEKQKIKLISCQARRISIQDWEVVSLVDICKSKGWIDKGLAVLYEYAGYIDDFKSLSEERSNAIEELFNVLPTVSVSSVEGRAQLVHLAAQVVALTASVIRTLCEWRKLQWSPRPVFFEQLGCKVSFPAALRDEAESFLAICLDKQRVQVNVFEVLPAECVISFLAPLLSFSELLKLHDQFARSNFWPHAVPTAVLDDPQLRSPDGDAALLHNSIRELLALEDRIEASWKALCSAVASVDVPWDSASAPTDPSASTYSLFPTLRLPYKDFKPPTEDLAWFRDALPQYASLEASIVLRTAEAVSASDPSVMGSGGESSLNEPAGSPEANRSHSSDGASGGGVVLELHNTSPIVLRKTRPVSAVSAARKAGIRSGGALSPDAEATETASSPPWRDTTSSKNSSPEVGIDPLNEQPRSLLPHERSKELQCEHGQQLGSSYEDGREEGRDSLDLPPGKRLDGLVEWESQSPQGSPQATTAQRGGRPLSAHRSSLMAGAAGAALTRLPEKKCTPLQQQLQQQAGWGAGARASDHAASESDSGSEEGRSSGDDQPRAGARAGAGLSAWGKSTRTNRYNNSNSNSNNNREEVDATGDSTAVTQSSQHALPSGAGERKRSVTVAVVGARSQASAASAADADVRRRMTVGAVAYHHHSPVPPHLRPRKRLHSPQSPSGASSAGAAAVEDLPSRGRHSTMRTGVSDDSVDERSYLSTPYEMIYKAPSDDFTNSPTAAQLLGTAARVSGDPQSPALSQDLDMEGWVETADDHPQTPPISQAPPSSSPSSSGFRVVLHQQARQLGSYSWAHVSSAHSYDATFDSPQLSSQNHGHRQRVHSAGHGETLTDVRSHPSSAQTYSHNRSPSHSRGHRPLSSHSLNLLSRPLQLGDAHAPQSEAQLVHYALRNLEYNGVSLAELAALKIGVWWRLVAPRKKLLRRMFVRDCVLDVVGHVVDRAVVLGTAQRRRRRHLLRQGAAMKIQRCFRRWSATVLADERRAEMEERSKIAWERLDCWILCVLAGLRIFRYIRYARRKKLIKNTAPKGSRLHQTIPKVILNYTHLYALSRKLRIQRKLLQSMGVTDSPAQILNMKRGLAFKERIDAATAIQRCFRRYSALLALDRQHRANMMSAKITYFLIGCISKRRVKMLKRKQRAVTKLQTFIRGVRTRQSLLRVVRSGLRLNAMWRQHVAYKSLKSQLRRVDKPHTIVMYGLRNLPRKTLNSDSLSFKVSVWWHPLLHIVSQNDFGVILQSKQPQFIYKSSVYYVDEEGQTGNRRMSISQSLRKLSSLLHSAPARQSTYLESLALNKGFPDKALRLHQQSSNSLKNTSRDGRPVLPPISSIGETEGGGDASSAPSSKHSNARKESVEAPRPSALVMQLDSILSDEESSDACGASSASPLTFEEEEHSKLSPDAARSRRHGGPGSGDADDTPPPATINGRSRRSFLQERMGSSAAFSGRETLVRGQASGQGTQATGSGSGSGSGYAVREKRSSGLQQSAMMTLAPLSTPPNMTAAGALGYSSPHSSFYKRRGNSTGLSVVRSTLSIFSSSGSGKHHQPGQRAVEEPRLFCSFEDEVVKIPGCHGNSVLKFDIFEGDRKYGTCVYFLSKGGEMMYWGGEYALEVDLLQQRRAVQLNSHLVQNGGDRRQTMQGTHTPQPKLRPHPNGSHGGASPAQDAPLLDFRIIAGAPLRSKCSWGRVLIRGNGPLRRLVQGRDMISSFLFDKWRRFYFSLDEFGLFMYDNKFDTAAFCGIPVKDLRRVRVEKAIPVRHSPHEAGKNIVEDIHNVMLTTYSGDELYMRFPDSGTRVSWHEVLLNAIAFQRQFRHSPDSPAQTPSKNKSSGGGEGNADAHGSSSWLSKSTIFSKKHLAAPSKGASSSSRGSDDDASSASHLSGR